MLKGSFIIWYSMQILTGLSLVIEDVDYSKLLLEFFHFSVLLSVTISKLFTVLSEQDVVTQFLLKLCNFMLCSTEYTIFQASYCKKKKPQKHSVPSIWLEFVHLWHPPIIFCLNSFDFLLFEDYFFF